MLVLIDNINKFWFDKSSWLLLGADGLLFACKGARNAPFIINYFVTALCDKILWYFWEQIDALARDVPLVDNKQNGLHFADDIFEYVS